MLHVTQQQPDTILWIYKSMQKVPSSASPHGISMCHAMIGWQTISSDSARPQSMSQLPLLAKKAELG